MRNFCKDIKEHAIKIIHFEKLKMLPLTNKENKSHSKHRVCYICGEKINNDKNYWKV